MSRRHENKKRARERRTLRRNLLHTAGCVFDSAPFECLYWVCLPEMLEEARKEGVRVPRSLRGSP